MAEAIPKTSPRPRLTITQEAIDRAVSEDSGHCVIAEAIREQVPDAAAVSVDLQAIRWTDRKKGVRYVYFTPPYAQDLLLAFDLGMTIKPQTIKMGGAFQILPIKAASRSKAAESAARRVDLEAKETAGTLSAAESAALARRRKHDEVTNGEPRPTTTAPRVAEMTERNRMVVTGGKAPGMAVLAHGRGRRRQYGLKVSGRPENAARFSE